MASRRDQLQSYQFLVHRVISALVMRETDPAESPLRRGVGALFAGFMISVIVAAGFGVYGLITKVGNSKWQVNGEVVVEKETGAVFLYEGGILHPMANYASALLASGHVPRTTASVSANSLLHIPRGGLLGIPNAPNALPDQGRVASGAWSVCAVPTTDSGGNQTASTLLVVSQAPSGAQRLPEGRAVLARLPNGTYYLVYRGYRYQMRQVKTVLPSLYPANSPSVIVTPAWLNTLNEGRSIDPITVPDAGAPSNAVHGHKNGDLLVTNVAGGTQYYLVFNDGLALISELQKDVYVGQTGAQPISIPIVEGRQAPRSSKLNTPNDGDVEPPSSPPQLVQPSSSQDPVCTRTGDPQQGRPSVWLGGALPNPSVGTQSTGVAANGGVLANRVVVPAGQIAVVRILASPTATAGAYNIVTDTGVRYPVVSAAALAMLGYDATKALNVPAEFATLIPAGPTLDPALAGASIDVTAR